MGLALQGTNLTRVCKANTLYQLVADACAFLHEQGIFWSVENPARSFMWVTSPWRHFFKKHFAFFTRFHHCMFGGRRAKHTLLVHAVPSFLQLARECDRSHTHSKWGKSGHVWATAQETAYPWPLAKAVSEFLLEQLVQCGLQKLPSCLPEVSYSIRNARAFSGLQSNKRILPLVPEYKMICMVTGSFQCNFRPKERCPNLGRCRPPGRRNQRWLTFLPAVRFSALTTFWGIQVRVLQEPPLEFTGSLRSS